MKCQKCGYEVEVSMKFCPICGSEVTYVQQNSVVKKCSNCGTELEEGIRFCPNCGQRTEQENTWNPQAAVGQVQKSEPVMNTAQRSVQNAAMRNSGQDDVQNAAMRNSGQGNAYMEQDGDLSIENVKENGQTLCFQRREGMRTMKSRGAKTTVVISENDIKINKTYIKLKILSKTEEKVFAKSEVAFANLRTKMDTEEIIAAGFFIGLGFLGLICGIISGTIEAVFGGLLGFALGAWYFWNSYGQVIDIKSVRGETYSIPFDGGKHKQEAQFLLNVCNRSKMLQA